MSLSLGATPQSSPQSRWLPCHRRKTPRNSGWGWGGGCGGYSFLNPFSLLCWNFTHTGRRFKRVRRETFEGGNINNLSQLPTVKRTKSFKSGGEGCRGARMSPRSTISKSSSQNQIKYIVLGVWVNFSGADQKGKNEKKPFKKKKKKGLNWKQQLRLNLPGNSFCRKHGKLLVSLFF